MKKEEVLVYPAVFTKEKHGYSVEFIDLKGCFTNGKTLAEAMEYAKEAMGLYLEDLKEYPNATEDVKDIKLKKNQIVSYVAVNMYEYKKKYSNASVKKTLSIPAWLNTMAEEQGINFSKVLQEALKEKLAIQE